MIILRVSKKKANNWRQKIVSSNRIYNNLIIHIHFYICYHYEIVTFIGCTKKKGEKEKEKWKIIEFISSSSFALGEGS